MSRSFSQVFRQDFVHWLSARTHDITWLASLKMHEFWNAKMKKNFELAGQVWTSDWHLEWPSMPWMQFPKWWQVSCAFWGGVCNKTFHTKVKDSDHCIKFWPVLINLIVLSFSESVERKMAGSHRALFFNKNRSAFAWDQTQRGSDQIWLGSYSDQIPCYHQLKYIEQYLWGPS